MKTLLARFVIIFTIVFLIVLGTCSLAKPASTAASDYVTHHIALVEVERFPVVNVSINGGNKLKFIIDTGAQRTILAPKTRHSLNLAGNRNDKTVMSGLTGAIDSFTLAETKIQLGNSSLKCPVIMLSYSDKTVEQNDVYKEIFAKYDGILGMDYFYGAKLSIDGQNRSVAVTIKKGNGKTVCGLTFKRMDEHKIDNMLRNAVLSVELEDMKFDILADTGLADNKVIMFLPNNKTRALWGKASQNYTMANVPLFGNLPLKQTLFPNVKISGKTSENMMVLLPSPWDDRYTDKSTIDGFIGWKYLRYGVLDVDYSSNDNNYASFHFHENWDNRQNLSGMREGLAMTPKGEIVFNKVDKNSPADVAGIQKDDKIIKLDGARFSMENPEGFFDALAGKKGNVSVQLLRNGAIIDTELIFNDYLLQNSINK